MPHSPTYLIFILLSLTIPILGAESSFSFHTANHERAEEVARYGHWIFDLDSNRVYTSRGARRLYGTDEDTPQISTVQKIPLKEYRDTLDKALQALITKEEPYNVTFRIHNRRTDDTLWIRSAAEYEAKENVVFGIIQDITAQKNAKEDLERSRRTFTFIAVILISVLTAIIILLLFYILQNKRIRRKHVEAEENFYNIFEKAPLSIMVYDGSSYELIQANPMAWNQYGYSSFGQLQENDLFIEPPWSEADALKKLQETQKTGLLSFEWKSQRADGSIMWEQVKTFTLRQNSRENIVVMGLDSTQEKFLQQELLEKNTLLERAGQSAHFGGWKYNCEEKTLFWSDEVALIHKMPRGFSPTLETGLSFYTTPWREKISHCFTACLENGLPYDEEAQITAADDTKIWVRTTGEAIMNAEGKIISVAGSLQDISKQKDTEEVLRRKEHFLSTVINSITQPFAVINVKDHRVSMANEAYGGRAAVGKKCYEAAHKDSVPCFDHHQNCPLEKVRTTGKQTTVEHIHFLPSGKHRHMEIHAYPVFDTRGEVTQIIEHSIDVTEKKHIMETLEKSERKYRQLFENMITAFALHEMVWDEAGNPVDYRFIEVNPAFEEMTGLSAEEITGKTVYEILPDTEQEWIERYGEVTRTKKPLSYENYSRELNKHFKVWAYAPEENRFAVVFVDITERIQAEEQLRQNEAKLAAFFSAMTEMVLICKITTAHTGTNSTYTIIDCNPAFTHITGISAQKARNTPADRVFNQTPPPFLKELTAVNRDKTPLHLEYHYAARDKYLSVSVVSLMDNMLALIATDITETHRSRELIQQKNRELEQIIYVASHDLRSPLVNIDGYSRELNLALGDIRKLFESKSVKSERRSLALLTQEIEEDLEHIQKSAAQMDGLLRGLLKLSRLGRAAIHIEDVEMNSLISEILQNTSYLIKKHGVTVETGNLPSCSADRMQLHQVFTNLIVNGIKYRRKDTPCRLKISGRTEDKFSIYLISDNGRGIAQRNLSRIFELFHRITPGEDSGEGLGLTISQQIIHRLGGEIWVESTPKEGSTFYIQLPRIHFPPEAIDKSE
jgi:PAS domain S-box-containing protein